MSDVVSRIRALAAAGSSAVVIGRPGTGKTRLLAEVYARMAAEVDPSTLLVLTPERNHADALRDSLQVPADAVLSTAPARSISSYAYGLVRAAHSTATGEELGFISGADQDVFLAELLAGHEAGWGRMPAWPVEFTAEVRATSAFRTEIRDALNRVMEYDFGVALPPTDDAGEFVFDSGRSALHRVLATAADPRWAALAQVHAEYLDILAMPGYGGIDSATVLARAAFDVLREPPEVFAGRRWSFAPETVPRLVLVDAAQDLPTAAFGLLKQLQERGTSVICFGTPETVTGRFHGADASLLDRFATTEDTIVLDEVHVDTPGLVSLQDSFVRRITTRWGLGHIPRTEESQAEESRGTGSDTVDGRAVETHVFASQASQYRFLARRINDFVVAGHSWSDTAVICRNTSTARLLAGELATAGIPTQQIEQALSLDPATRPLLDLMDFDLDAADLATRARSLAGSVYIHLDPLQMRRFRRQVRSEFPAADSDASLVLAIRAHSGGENIPGLSTLRAMVQAAAAHRNSDPHESLWAIWDAAGLAESWQAAALQDPDSPFNAHLDAVLRLFTLAEKITDRGGFTARSFAGIVAEQDIAQDSLAEQAGFIEHVTVGTPTSLAHRRFALVAIAEVNEGVWPNPKLRGGMLGLADLTGMLKEGARITDDPGYWQHARKQNLREEGELFYTAMTRAEDLLIVTACADEETAPSPFFDVVATADPSRGDGDSYVLSHEDELPPLSLAEIAAHSRARLLAAAAEVEPTVTDVPDPELADHARLLSSLHRRDVASAPERWREAEDISSTQPLYGEADTVQISPSQVEGFTTCSLRWFLTRNGGDRGGTLAQDLGTILHAAAEKHPQGPTSALREFVDAEFAGLSHASEWERQRDHDLAMSMVERLGDYIKQAPGELVGVEVQVYADGTDEAGRPWRVTGRLDRIENTEGGIRIVDFKTGGNVVAAGDMAHHAQLGVYQEAINSGTITLSDGRVLDAQAYGAELVYLRKSSRTLREQPTLAIAEDPGWARTLIGEVSGGMRAASFPATVDPPVCRSCPVRTSCPATGPQHSEDL